VCSLFNQDSYLVHQAYNHLMRFHCHLIICCFRGVSKFKKSEQLYNRMFRKYVQALQLPWAFFREFFYSFLILYSSFSLNCLEMYIFHFVGPVRCLFRTQGSKRRDSHNWSCWKGFDFRLTFIDFNHLLWPLAYAGFK
jgi:hypothetical protein